MSSKRFCFVFKCSLEKNYNYAARMLSFLACYIFSTPTAPFCTHVSSICPTANDETTNCKYFQYSELVCKENSSTLNWCARKIPVSNHWSATTARNNHNRDIFNSHLCFTSVLVLNYFKQFILYGWWKTKDFNKINYLSLNESKEQSLWTNE